MFKRGTERLACALCVAFLFLIGLTNFSLYSPRVYAATPQVTLSLAMGGTPITGHVGTKVHISGTGFPNGQVNLFTTTNNDPAKCNNNNAGALGLTPFTPANVQVGNDGNFTVDAPWPASAANTGSSYYICAANSPNAKAVSGASFTVAPQQTINVSPITLAAGQQITVTGANWLPPQPLTISITGPNAPSPAATSQVSSDQAGNFTSTLTIPPTAPAGSYSVSVVANNEPTLKVVNDNFVTVTAVTPTPTVTPSPTITATPSPTPTTTVAPSQGSNPPSSSTPTNSTETFLLVTLAGLGVLLVVVGVILFIMYSRGR